jgi:beta-glucanase (GH16 family)
MKTIHCSIIGTTTSVWFLLLSLTYAACTTAESLNADCWKLTFSDEFNHLHLRDGDKGIWKTSYIWGNEKVINNELQYYIDPRIHGESPFKINSGQLIIQAKPATPSLRKRIRGRRYTSGLITTENSFSQRYGRFELRAMLPAGRGLWPAFWLLPAISKWPEGIDVLPEIDIMEFLGHHPDIYYSSVHTNQSGKLKSFSNRNTAPGNLTTSYHIYGIEWNAREIKWFLDGKLMDRKPTPKDLNTPMIIQINLAVGGHWPGNPDAATRFPAEFRIDYVRAYQRNSNCR